jgi:cell division septation protein DedD
MSRADTELFKDKVEVSLDGRQIFYLFFGGAVIACLVFVLGVMVGKRVEARSHVHSEASTSAARDPLAALDQLSADADHLSFPSALSGESNKPLGAVDAVLAVARADAEEDGVIEPAPAPAAKKPEPPKAKPEAAKPDEPAPAKAKPEAAKPAEEAKPEASKGSYTLQLSSFQDRGEADSFHAKLVDAGLHPYIVEAAVPDKGTWYRVRLGSYDDYDQAIRGKKEFESRHKIIAYVTRVKR